MLCCTCTNSLKFFSRRQNRVHRECPASDDPDVHFTEKQDDIARIWGTTKHPKWYHYCSKRLIVLILYRTFNYFPNVEARLNVIIPSPPKIVRIVWQAAWTKTTSITFFLDFFLISKRTYNPEHCKFLLCNLKLSLSIGF